MIDTDIRTELHIDHGPVASAAAVLIARSTLADHVLVEHEAGRGVMRVWHDPGDVPFGIWGAGTQALWRLLSAMAYTSETVSLYEVLSRTDARNSRAIAEAVSIMAGASA